MNRILSAPWQLIKRARCQAVGSRRFISAAASSDGSLPLEGYRVLDMTRVLAGPYCTQILGDLGAEVIKVEHPIRGDDTRAWGPPYAQYKPGSSHKGPGESAYFLGVVNRNKKSLALSFQEPAGVEILHELAAKCDILVENYIPGALKKYGMDYESIRKINPGLIYASITGYGQTGPYSQRAGYDVMVEAEFGLMHITGNRDGPPVKVGVAVTDLTTGLYTSNSIMAALLARAKTGRGQHIDAALSDCQTATLANIASSCLISGERDTGRWGTAHPSIVPYKSFETKDGDILFGGGNDHLFGILCDGIGRPEWKEDPKFKINAQRVAHRNELEGAIESITVTKTTQEWLDLFEGKGLPYAAVNDVLATLSHDHTKARDMVIEVDHDECGPIKLVNSPVKYSETKPRVRSPPPTLGQHTDEVLREHLGLDAAQIRQLRENGVQAFAVPTMADSAPADDRHDNARGSKRDAPAEMALPRLAQTQVAAAASPSAPSSPAVRAPSSSSAKPPYVPQFSAATQMILNRMKGEPASLSAALSRPSPSMTVGSIPQPTYEDVKRRLVMGMNTSTSMTLQMPAPRPSASPAPSLAHAHAPTPATTLPSPVLAAARHKLPALSAIRRISSGLTVSGKVPVAKAPKPALTEGGKIKKQPKTVTGPRAAAAGNKRKRVKGQNDDSSSLSSLSDVSEPETSAENPVHTKTKSGRQVQKPSTYNPAAMEAGTRKRVHYGKRTVEQALCKHCTRMASPASNQIVFCDACNDPWHQRCHDPWIDDQFVNDPNKAWYCRTCQAKRDLKAGPKRQKLEQLPKPKEDWASKTPQQKRAYLSTLPQQELVALLMNSLELHPDLPIFPPSADSDEGNAQGVPPPARRSLFAGATTEGLFPRSDANPYARINYIRPIPPGVKPAVVRPNRPITGSKKDSNNSNNNSNKEDSQERPADEGEDAEFDPLAPLWPKSGMGLYSKLPPDTEDDARLVDDDDYEAFSVITYNERGQKLKENGMPV
ncbi:CoA-transferase family III domain-containing protein [Podospora didyma]|uniref:CoA-transferase family III domain-containing protein n=1 Tax=Podospora didyma TaxID=330526 RepID=A0AAE0U4M5_9PEZI|nr:CoA-transferase family III domain-containing protein [Podospora didyma]